MVHLFVALLMAVQLVTFLGMRYAIEEAAHRSLREELNVGSRVFDRLLLTQGQQLGEAASVLSADFGFRDAVASRDRKTVRSALVNHAERYKTSRMALVDLNGVVLADSLVLGNEGRRFPHMDLMSTQTVSSVTDAPAKAGGEVVSGDDAVARIVDLLEEAKVI